MKTTFFIVACLLVLVSAALTQSHDAERKVTKVQRSANQTKTITDIFKNDVLVRKETETERTGDKAMRSKYTRFYQGGEEVLFEGWDSISKETIRFFKVAKRTVVAELDRDGDGVFEWLVVYGKDEEMSSVYRRASNGRIEALDNADLESFKKGERISDLLLK